MHRKAFALIFTAAAAFSAASPTLACSYGGNSYSRGVREPLDGRLASAAYVELVSIEAAGASACPRLPSTGAAEAVLDEWRATVSDDCREPADADLQATIIERFKGDGTPQFALLWAGAAAVGRPFSDVRSLSRETEADIAEGERIRADDGHFRDDFWLQADLDFAQDQTDSCGGRFTLVPSLDYVVFRNRHGHVLVAEPVSREDDALLAWLRRARLSGEPARIFTPEEAFATASSLALIQIERCERLEREDYSELIVWARLLRGRAPSLLRGGFHAVGPAEEAMEAYYLDEWLDHTERECRAMDLLVVETDGHRGGVYNRVWVPPMPAAVSGGAVRVSELFPGVPLTGAEVVSVEDAFLWHQAGEGPPETPERETPIAE